MQEITLGVYTLVRNVVVAHENVSTDKKDTKGATNTVAVKTNLTDEVGTIIVNTFIAFTSSMTEAFHNIYVKRRNFI
jgi:hypothetical protein